MWEEGWHGELRFMCPLFPTHGWEMWLVGLHGYWGDLLEKLQCLRNGKVTGETRLLVQGEWEERGWSIDLWKSSFIRPTEQLVSLIILTKKARSFLKEQNVTGKLHFSLLNVQFSSGSSLQPWRQGVRWLQAEAPIFSSPTLDFSTGMLTQERNSTAWWALAPENYWGKKAQEVHAWQKEHPRSWQQLPQGSDADLSLRKDFFPCRGVRHFGW